MIKSPCYVWLTHLVNVKCSFDSFCNMVLMCHIIYKGIYKYVPGWWFQIFFSFTPIWGRFPFWRIFFNWVETTTLVRIVTAMNHVNLNSFKWLLSHRCLILNVSRTYMHNMFFIACTFFLTSVSDDFQINSLGGASGQTFYMFQEGYINPVPDDPICLAMISSCAVVKQSTSKQKPLVHLELFPNSSLFWGKKSALYTVYTYIYR